MSAMQRDIKKESPMELGEIIEPVLEGEIKAKIHPALDFINAERLTFGVYLPCKTDKGFNRDGFCLIDDQRNVLPINLVDNIEVSHRPVPMQLRWSLSSINQYKNGEIEALEPAAMFRIIKSQYKKAIDFYEPAAYDFFPLWVIGSYLYPVFKYYPYVYLGGLKESGKTKVLYLTSILSFNSIFSGNMSSSALFRLIQNNRCSLFIDETELLSNPKRAEEFRSLLLSGYKRGNYVYRVEKDTRGNFRPLPFLPYSPKMLANIQGLESILESRCISFIMKRTINRAVGDYEIDEESPEWQQTRDHLYIFALRYWSIVKLHYDSLENNTQLSNRDWELWKPILSIAKLVSNDLYGKTIELAERKSRERLTENVTESADYMLVEVLLELVVKDDYYPIKDIREKVIAKYEESQEPSWLNNKWIGRAMKRLGFLDKRRRGSGIDYRLNKDMVADLSNRLMITTAQTTQTTLTTLNNAVSVVSEVSVVDNKGVKNDKKNTKKQ